MNIEWTDAIPFRRKEDTSTPRVRSPWRFKVRHPPPVWNRDVTVSRDMWRHYHASSAATADAEASRMRNPESRRFWFPQNRTTTRYATRSGARADITTASARAPLRVAAKRRLPMPSCPHPRHPGYACFPDGRRVLMIHRNAADDAHLGKYTPRRETRTEPVQ